ncbi:MAG: DUF3575 domain-containing protein [Bacteroidia bacterium]|nr:DUF3575 domain-containing protein [Bacteroidia bacterium]MCC6768413.1 DUF3575 domain-containing protein [Bacteroidia bacterium]
MKKYLFIIIILLIGLPVSVTNAQIEKGNIIKLNLSPLAFNHFSVQYERVINPKQSFGLGFSFAPNVGLPFKQTLLDAFDDNAEAVEAIESTKFTKYTLTPEYRFYFGAKGAPVGFYLATFIRYTNMSTSQIYKFTTSKGVVHRPNLTTTFNGVGGGAMIGMQWALGKSFTLDWWIVGPFFGYMKGSSGGTDKMDDMDQQDKDDLKKDIEEFPIPLWKKDATIGNGTIDVKLKGPFYGARAMGICFGYRF